MSGEKRPLGTYQVQHEVKSDCLELFNLQKQKGRGLAGSLRHIQCRALLSPVVLAADSADCRLSSGELKDLGPAGSVRSNSLQEDQKVATISVSVPCERVAPPGTPAGCVQSLPRSSLPARTCRTVFLEVGGRKYSRSSKTAFKQQKAEEVGGAGSHPRGLAGQPCLAKDSVPTLATSQFSVTKPRQSLGSLPQRE